MSKRINQLPPDTAPDAAIIFEGERAGVSYRLTVAQLQALFAASMALTGVPTAPTAAPGTNTTQIATTAFAAAMLALKADLASPTFTGTPAAPTASPGANTTQLATTAFVAALGALKANLASPGFTGTPTGPTPAVGTNTTQLATAAMVQAEIANKRAWTSYTPTVVASSGTFTTVGSVTGSYMTAFGICYVRVNLTITTVGTGQNPRVSLPLPALSGSAGMPMSAAERAVNGKSGVFVIEPGLTTGLVLGADAVNLATGNGAQITIMGSYPTT